MIDELLEMLDSMNSLGDFPNYSMYSELHDKASEILDEYNHVIRERDAAVEDLKDMAENKSSCMACKYEVGDMCESSPGCWQWRGVQEGGGEA